VGSKVVLEECWHKGVGCMCKSALEWCEGVFWFGGVTVMVFIAQWTDKDNPSHDALCFLSVSVVVMNPQASLLRLICCGLETYVVLKGDVGYGAGLKQYNTSVSEL